MKFYFDEIIFKIKGIVSFVCKLFYVVEGWSFVGVMFGVKFFIWFLLVKNREFVLLKWERFI